MTGRLVSLWLIVAACALSWLAMMAVHEFGHMLHAWLSGGHVAKVVLHPLAISRTDVSHNSHPLFVVWGGPIWGTVLPLFVWRVARWRQWRYTYLLAFFAGFCAVANGAYLGAGVWMPVGDAVELVRLGTPRWVLAAFGIAAPTVGLALWNGLGSHFGLGPNAATPDERAAAVLTGMLVMLVIAELLLSERL